MSRLPKPPLTAHPTAFISSHASLTGTHPITIGANTVLHLRCRLISEHGPIEVGEGCIISERAVVGLESKCDGDDGIAISSSVLIESVARIEGCVGEGSRIEAGAVVEKGAAVGKYCTLTPHTRLAANEILPDYTVVYGDHKRRVEKPGLEGLRAKAVERHVETLKGLGMR